MILKKEELEVVIEGCKRNDRKAQRLLYETYYGRFMSLTLRYVKDYEEAQECLNYAFLRIFKKIDYFTNLGSFEGWMNKIVVRQAFSTVQQKERKKGRIFYYEEIEKEDTIKTDEDLRVKDILKIIESLPKRTSEVFKLYLDGKTHREIGIESEMTEGTSKWHVSKARELIKERMKILDV